MVIKQLGDIDTGEGIMKSLYNKNDALAFIKKYADHPKDLALRIYTSRLLGANNSLVLHGGGNTSVKLKQKNILGEENDVIFVKGSGQDLSVIEPEGFTGLNLNSLIKLRRLESITDTDMENLLHIHRTSAWSPDPSVEALLHAFLPHKYIDHTHADGILILSSQKNGEALISEALGPNVVVLPYIRSGFPLAKVAAEGVEKKSDIEAIVILGHGIFTFAEDARRAYENMIEYVSRAEIFIEDRLRGKPVGRRRTDLSSLDNFSFEIASEVAA